MIMAAKTATIPLLIIVLMICGSITSAAQQEDEAFVDHAMRQIACAYPPDPTATLIYLNKAKRIKKGERADSETCWGLAPPLRIEGVAFTHICASAEDPLLIKLFPRLYNRGPGTSAGTGLRLVTNEGRPAVEGWLKRIRERAIAKSESKTQIGDSSFVTGKTEVSCNSMSFLGE